jgi:hypothetical protein
LGPNECKRKKSHTEVGEDDFAFPEREFGLFFVEGIAIRAEDAWGNDGNS